MKFAPTDQQVDATDGIKRGENAIVQAGAGTGKTTVITNLGMRNKKIYIFSFNKEIQLEIKKKVAPFSNMTAYTIHGYAHGRMRPYIPRLNSRSHFSAQQTADYLALDAISLDSHNLSAAKVGQLVMRTIDKFCKSSDWQISAKYRMPFVSGLSYDEVDYLRGELEGPVQEAWADIQRTSGALNFKFTHLIKLWALSPKLSSIAADVVLVDEAQDVMACVMPVLERRVRAGRQVALFGDEYQAINEWNGAQDAMNHFSDFKRYMLDKSFRFGEEIADVANIHLEAMDADMRLTGTGNSVVGPIEFPDAILCRTNAGTIDAAIRELQNDRSVALLGNTSEFTNVADSALALMSGQPADHYLFTAFNTWPEVVNFANSDDPEADEIKTWVKLIETYGAQEIKDLTSSLVSPDVADVIVSTAHKTKGKEFGTLRVGNDFPDGEELTHEITKADHMLDYVTVSRAQTALEPGVLASARSKDN